MDSQLSCRPLFGSTALFAEDANGTCPFYLKIGACRHGDQCSRHHVRPTSSQTLLLSHIYPVQLAGPPDPPPQDALKQKDSMNNSNMMRKQNQSNPNSMRSSQQAALRIASGEQNPDDTEQELFEYNYCQKHLEDFYDEIFHELASYGEVEDLIIADNVSDHMLGNVYVKFYSDEDAEKALQKLTGRYYGGKQIKAEFSPVTDFREARCRAFHEARCNRGGYCNFLHVKHIPRANKRRLVLEMYEDHPHYAHKRERVIKVSKTSKKSSNNNLNSSNALLTNLPNICPTIPGSDSHNLSNLSKSDGPGLKSLSSDPLSQLPGLLPPGLMPPGFGTAPGQTIGSTLQDMASALFRQARWLNSNNNNNNNDNNNVQSSNPGGPGPGGPMKNGVGGPGPLPGLPPPPLLAGPLALTHQSSIASSVSSSNSSHGVQGNHNSNDINSNAGASANGSRNKGGGKGQGNRSTNANAIPIGTGAGGGVFGGLAESIKQQQSSVSSCSSTLSSAESIDNNLNSTVVNVTGQGSQGPNSNIGGNGQEQPQQHSGAVPPHHLPPTYHANNGQQQILNQPGLGPPPPPGPPPAVGHLQNLPLHHHPGSPHPIPPSKFPMGQQKGQPPPPPPPPPPHLPHYHQFGAPPGGPPIPNPNPSNPNQGPVYINYAPQKSIPQNTDEGGGGGAGVDDSGPGHTRAGPY